MKKINFLAISAVAAMCGFTSCDDKNECGCDCNQPIVERIEMVNNPGVSIPLDSAIAAGNTVALFGENLGSVKAIYFAEEKAELKPAFVTDNTIVFTVPTVYSTCKARFVTAACQAGFEGYPIVKVSPATVTMIYNEFASDTIKLKGNSFIASEENPVDVYFYGEGDELIKSPKTVVISENEIAAAIPEGVADTKPIRVTNVAAPSAEEAQDSKILFRDKRNILVDFEPGKDVLYMKGDTISGKYPVMEIGKSGEGYGYIDDKSWDAKTFISYQPYLPDFAIYDESVTVFGDFALKIKNKEYDINNFCLKFEINVPEDKKMQFDVMAIGFTDGKASDLSTFRKYSAYFNPCIPNLDTNKDGVQSIINSGCKKSFSTNGWMTVCIPFSEFIFNASAMSYGSSYANLIKGDFSKDKDYTILADPANVEGYVSKRSYSEYYSNPQHPKFWGGLVLGFTPNDGGDAGHLDFAMGIDNIRIVPYDGNGAYYPALTYGEPACHFYDKPILK